MKLAEKTRRIQSVLDELVPETDVPLRHRDPFTLLVAVVLSAQTTDKMVNRVTPELFARAPTPLAMSQLEVAEIEGVIRTVGLAPSKAKAISTLSRQLLERHAGEVPRTFEELEALAGVGHKSASVVMAQAFGVPAFPVDTHIHRLAARWGLSSGRSVVQTERDLKRLFPEEAWNRLHIQLIRFGRGFCPARAHDLESCPICSFAASKARVRMEQAGGGSNRTRRRRKA
jgi:endonuclease-3